MGNNTGLIISFSFLILACSNKNENNTRKESSRLNAIIGTDDRAEIDASMRQFIGYISVNGVEKCTAFISGENEITTSFHCYPGESIINGDEIIFKTGDNRSYQVLDVASAFPDADVITFKLSADGLSFVRKADNFDIDKPISVYSYDLSTDSFVMHANCYAKSFVDNTGILIHECDTVPGSSGSPIIQDGKLIGVHIGSYDEQFNLAAFAKDLNAVSLRNSNLMDKYIPERFSVSKFINKVVSVAKTVITAVTLPSAVKNSIIDKIGYAVAKDSRTISEVRKRDFDRNQCNDVGSAIIAGISAYYSAPICTAIGVSTAAYGGALCYGVVAGGGKAITSSTCAYLCHDKVLKGCR